MLLFSTFVSCEKIRSGRILCAKLHVSCRDFIKSVPLIEEITVTFHGGIELKNVAVDQIGIGRVFEPGIGIVQLPFGELQIVSQGFFGRF